MKCVNKSSREFIRLAKDNNLDANTLELIIHKFQEASGMEDAFPSDVYIQAQLGHTEYKERDRHVRKVWKNNYSNDLSYDTYDDLQRAVKKALRIFPKEAVGFHKNDAGKFILTVKKPVQRLGLAEGKVPRVYNAEGSIIPATSRQEVSDYMLIARETAQNTNKSIIFAPSELTKLNQKVLQDLKQTLQLDRYESRNKRNAGTDEQGNSSADGGLLGESQTRIQGRDRNLRETQEQRVLTPRQLRERNSEDKKSLEQLAKEQGRWRPDVDARLEEAYGKRIGHGSESFVYRKQDGPVIKSRTIDPDVEGRYKSIEEALTSIETHNRLFPETAMKIVGYGESDGEFNVILEQPYIEGRFATNEEIQQFINERFGVEKDDAVIGNTSYKTAAYLLQDLKPQNVIVKDGNLYVIDGDFYLTEQHRQYLRLQEKMQEDKQAEDLIQFAIYNNRNANNTFTFNDGTVINVPFKPNEQQAEALNAMNDFIHSDETSMTLSGYAGTGKTSLMEIIAKKMRGERRGILFSATTNKAAAVLQSRVSRSGFEAKTLNKVFGINVEVDSTKAYNTRNKVINRREADIPYGTVVVIDEASMINEENYRILNEIARENGLKIIYVGDKAQLAPVNETQVSKVFRNTEGRIVELTQVERTADNAILKEATDLRNGKPLSGETSFNSRGEGVAYLKPSSKEEIGRVIRNYLPGLKENPDFFRILAYTNEAVAGYNNYVRGLLGYTDAIPKVGEPVVGYANWGYDYRTARYRFINSESYKVTKTGQPEQVSLKIGDQTYTMTAVPVTVEDSVGNTDTFNYMDIKYNKDNLKAATELARQKNVLWDEWRRAVSREVKKNKLSQINLIDQFLFVNDNIELAGRRIQDKVVDFGYALTVHKSQGSTFTHVLMDDNNIAKASNTSSNAANAMSDVDLGNPGALPNVNAVADDLSEEIDLGDLSGVEAAPSYSKDNAPVNIRQQLEYVAVSRATDTVTVISNKTKTEGSPLDAKVTDTSKQDNEWQQEFIKEFEQHLKEKGIANVHGLAEMQQYLAEHGYIGIQEAINPFGKEKPYLNREQASEEEMKELLQIIKQKKYNKAGTDAVTLNSNSHQVIYLIDHSAHSELQNNLDEGGDGFGIRETFNVENLTENDIKRIIRNIASNYGHSEKRIRKVLQDIGIRPRNMLGINIAAELKRSLDDNAGIHAGGRGQGRGNWYIRSGKGSQENQTSTGQERPEDTAFFIGKKARIQFEQSLRKARPDMTDAEIQSTLDFLHSLEDNKENTAYIKTAIRWVANSSITLPQDNTKARQAFDLARKKNLDLQKYKTLGELITAPEMQPKQKEKKAFDPDKAKTFSNKHTVTTEGGRVFTVYDVENTEEGQREVCKALAAHYEMSPWCLSTFTATGEPTESAKRYWRQYNALPRKIAFENGKPVAFNSNDSARVKYYYKGKQLNFIEDTNLMHELVDLGYLDVSPFGLDITQKGEQALEKKVMDGWWDMEDTNPQDSLSDSIASTRSLASLPHEEMEEQERLAERARIQQELVESYLEVLSTEDVPFFLTPNGEVYAFVAPNGDIYIDETKVQPDHLIHEYTHLWDRAVQKRSPKLWKRGVELMKQTKLWNEIANDPNYGAKWKTVQGMTESKLESLIASEVHARLVGPGAEKILADIAKEKGGKGLIGKLKQWILDVWKDLKATFGNWSDEEISKLTLQDFDKMTVRDFADGVQLKQQEPVQQTSESEEFYSEQSAQDHINDLVASGVPRENIKLEHIPATETEDDYYVVSVSQTQQIQGKSIASDNAINQQENRSNNKTINYGEEFRRVQERVRKDSTGESRASVSKRDIGEDARQRLAKLLRRELESSSSFSNGALQHVSAKDRQGITHSFTIHKDVDPQLFHGIFEVARYYAPNGELVDLHDDYADCKCYLNEDGTCGFAITPEGNLISVFNIGVNKGFLNAAAPFILQEGATHLDAYNSNTQPLRDIYEKVFGAKVASSMDYNMEYDHDDIAKNHGNPEVVFMVMGKAAEGEITEKHFTKDQYDEAVEWQQNFISQQPSEQPQKINLSGYEYFKDLYEDTTVDAAWKIPMLQELDGQLSMENSAEENLDIIDRMDRILEAKTQEDLLDLQPEEPKQNKQVEQTLHGYEKALQQLDNLQNSGLISGTEIRHVAELTVNAISDLITDLAEGKNVEEVLTVCPQLMSDLSEQDFTTMTRKEIVEKVGIDNLIAQAKENFDPENNVDMEADMDTFMQADLIVNNWEGIMSLAADRFAFNEGFGIVQDFDNGRFTTTGNPTIDIDNLDDYGNDPDAMAESEKDEQEHWQVEQKTIDVLFSMSDLVRKAINQCYLTDRDGNRVMSKWGIAERVPARKAVNNILRWSQGTLTLSDIVDKLSEKSVQKPWLNQLIERLSDESGKETDFQGQFFGVFSRPFQKYTVVLLEDGKYHSIPVNGQTVLSEALQSMQAQYEIGQHPLFTDKGISEKYLGTDKTTYPEADFNLHKALSELQTLKDRLNHGEEFDGNIADKAVADITGVCRILGYPVTEEIVRDAITKEVLVGTSVSNGLDEKSSAGLVNYLGFIVKDLDAALQKQKRESGNPNAKVYNPFTFKSENGIRGTLRNFLAPIAEVLEDDAISAFYDSGKMIQSYITPSFMTKLMKKFSQEGQAFQDFMMEEYGNSEWFNTGNKALFDRTAWRTQWMRWLAGGAGIDHKVELNFNKHNYMRNMSDAEYTISLVAEYFSESTDTGTGTAPAWFKIPMLSNKPSSEFIKFLSYRGNGYKESITDGLFEIYCQELSRIQTVRMRNHSKNDPEFIKNFDSNGRHFCFLPELNDYLDGTQQNSELGKLLNRKVEGLSALSAPDEARLSVLVKEALRQNMENRANSILEDWDRNGILKVAGNIEGIHPKDLDEEQAAAWTRNQVENYLWNDRFAALNILELTVTDVAFYKDAEDLQKRLAQLHAPGIRGNVYARDYAGNRVSDGTYRTFVLNDFDSFKSNIIANIAEVFDRKISRAPEHQKSQLRALKESLVGKDGKYTKINVTDAQAFSSPSSRRKKDFMFGRWSRKAEEIYQNLKKGSYNFTDLETAFQPEKPFVYSRLKKNMGVDGAPITQMNVPFQAKNAEYLLIMADAIIKGEEAESGKLSRPNLLRAIYRVMEESERLNPTKGIDTVQFESAIKSGLQGRINLHQFLETPGGEDAAYAYMMKKIYQGWQSDAEYTSESQLQYNTDTYVHEAPYEDYCLQQEVPEHFKSHSQAHGSQIRMIIPSDLDLYKNPNADHSNPDNQVFYEFTDYDAEGNKVTRKVGAREFRKEYEDTIAESIGDSLDSLAEEFHLNSTDMRERNITLSKILIREILSSPRYGIELAQACYVDPKTGEFRIPKGDPIQAKRIEQLINSIIKNRVNKQKIAGGPIVQVSNFGTSKQLHIRFNDKNGNLLMTREEYEKDVQSGVTASHLSYEEYIKENQAGIAYFEVFLPIWSEELVEKFSNPDGSINMEAVEATDPELLKMISYRIPTEDKYSCAPMKCVGFMPREAGDAIMLPYELTEIDDSDFDVDKRYVMRKEIPIVRKTRKEVEQQLFETANESYKKAHDGKENKKYVGEQVSMFMSNPDRMRHSDRLMESLYREYQKIAYTTKAPTSGKLYRDNKIVDMTWGVLTNEMTADKILNPGGFDGPKKTAYMVAAYRNPANSLTWEQLQDKSIDELKDLSYVGKDLSWADTQVQFYKQNAAAASLIGVFAVNKVAHATLESNDILIAVDELCGNVPFTIADTEFGGRMHIDAKYDSQGNLIGKTLGSLVSASADAVKDPILNLMNINMTTAGMLNTMLRLGMPFDDAALFLSQSVIADILNEFNRENLDNYQPLSAIIEKRLADLREKHGIDEGSNINFEPLSREELVEGLTEKEHDVVDYKVLLAFQKIKALADAMRKPTFATRFNSISSAVGPLIIDNLIMEHKMEQFMTSNSDEDSTTNFYSSDGASVDIDDIFYDHPILKQFSKTVGIAARLFSDMPAGSTGFRQLLVLADDKVWNDKKLLDDLSMFYQSYLAVASGLIDTEDMRNVIEKFPEEFNRQKYKEQYADNLFVQSIQTGVERRTGRAFLNIKTTGMDESEKEKLRSAWTDLHKVNPELSKKLFEYCFFRTGIGFSPKSFMSLVPIYVKERLSTEHPDGTAATYVDTYRNFPSINPELVYDQWIRNNWNNNKLVPWKGGEGTSYAVMLKSDGTGELIARDPKDMVELSDVKYMKTKVNGQTILWKQVVSDKTSVHYTRISPLGDNGAYTEMSLSEIKEAMSKTTMTTEDLKESELKQDSPAESDAAEDTKTSIVTDNEKSKAIAEVVSGIQLQNPKLDRTQAENLLEKAKDNFSLYKKFFANVAKKMGLDLNENELEEWFKKMC